MYFRIAVSLVPVLQPYHSHIRKSSKKITRYVDSGADEVVTLLETTGTYSDTTTLPDGGNYVGIECEEFTGNIELNIE